MADIQHPEVDYKNLAYSVTLDQNLLNSFFIEMSTINSEISLRQMISLFDQQGQYISYMSTNLLQLNMPALKNEYGENRQFDVTFTID